MTEEEYFRKHYPDVCYNGKPLSPYWDLFQDGVEFGERQSEKKIEELKSELTKKADTNHSLVEQMADLENKNAELKVDNTFYEKACEGATMMYKHLTKAKELLKELQGYIENEDDELYDEIEQFLKEIEK